MRSWTRLLEHFVQIQVDQIGDPIDSTTFEDILRYKKKYIQLKQTFLILFICTYKQLSGSGLKLTGANFKTNPDSDPSLEKNWIGSDNRDIPLLIRPLK